MMTTLTLLDVLGLKPEQLVKNSFSLAMNKPFDKMMAHVTDPRLLEELNTDWSKYCYPSRFLGKKLPLKEALLVKEYDAIRLTETGFLAGQIHINLLVENRVTLEIFYSGSPHQPELAKLAFVLNDKPVATWEQVLATLRSDDFAKETFPSGYERYQRGLKIKNPILRTLFS